MKLVLRHNADLLTRFKLLFIKKLLYRVIQTTSAKGKPEEHHVYTQVLNDTLYLSDVIKKPTAV